MSINDVLKIDNTYYKVVQEGWEVIETIKIV